MKSERLWNRLAGNWDKPGVALGENDKKIIAKVREYLNRDSVILDYGCATGSVILELAGNVKKTYGLDISSKMIDKAKQKASERKTDNVSFVQGTIFSKNLKESSFDVILASNVLHLAETTPEVLNRVHLLLKPNGVFITVNPCLKEKNLISVILRAFLFLARLVGLLPKTNLFTDRKLVKLIDAAGFQIVENASLTSKMIDERYISAKKI